MRIHQGRTKCIIVALIPLVAPTEEEAAAQASDHGAQAADRPASSHASRRAVAIVELGV